MVSRYFVFGVQNTDRKKLHPKYTLFLVRECRNDRNYEAVALDLPLALCSLVMGSSFRGGSGLWACRQSEGDRGVPGSIVLITGYGKKKLTRQTDPHPGIAMAGQPCFYIYS